MDPPPKPEVARVSIASESAKVKAGAKPVGRLGPLLSLLLLVASGMAGRAAHPTAATPKGKANPIRKTRITLDMLPKPLGPLLPQQDQQEALRANCPFSQSLP